MGDRPVYKKDWVLTGEAHSKSCSLAWILTPEEAGRKLLEIRRRLQKFFECNRCPDPDRLVDITLDRGARRLDEGVDIRELNSYLSQVARFVLKEQWATEKDFDELNEEKLEASPVFLAKDQDEDEEEGLEARLACLEKCANKLVAAERQRIIDYYYEQRRAKIDNRKPWPKN